MKKLLIMSLVLLGIFLSSGSTAFAWHRGHFGFFFGPPRVLVGPPVLYGGYYPPYYGPGYYGPSRYWVPGHWESRWTPYGWQRFWVRGYWR